MLKLLKKHLIFIITLIIVITTIFLILITSDDSDGKKESIYWYDDKLNLKKLENQSIKIAFLDTGLNYDFQKTMNNKVVDGFNCIKNNTDYNDYNGHGTSIISLACYNGAFDYNGINKEIIVVPVVVADEFGVTNEDYLSAGIEYSISCCVKMINISLGSFSFSDKIENALKSAVEKGIIVNCSSGDNCRDKITYPASSKYTFAISSQSLLGCKYINSNFNETCILIPGEKIPVVKFDLYKNKYVVGIENGSSYACAIFTGILSCIIDDLSSFNDCKIWFNDYYGVENKFIDVKSINKGEKVTFVTAC